MAKAQSSIEARFAEAVELHRADRLAEARAAYLAILQDDPERVACYNNLGAIAVRQKDAPVADTMLRKAIELDPKNFDAFNNLGNLYANIGQREAAIAFYRSALDIDPGYLPARINLANELQATGQFPQALNEYGAALAANPLLVEAHSGLGTLLLTTADPREAAPCFMRAAVIQPGWTAAWNNLGGAMLQMSLLEQAARCLNRALILAGDFPNALLNLGNMMTSLGRTEDATHLYERILAIQPDHGPAISNLLLALNYADGLDADALAERHKRLGARLDEAASHAPALMRPSPAPRAGRIRIGYVSPDLRTHSVAYFFEPLLREHDRTRFEIFCYAELFSPDDMSRRLEAMADHWIPTVGLSDRALAERIVADGIDILVDLAGHSAYNRLAVFALRPAAIQVSWLGYPNTTGLSSIDYRLVDQISDPPPESDRLASEKLVRLEGGFHCYLPPADAPPVSAPPSAETGRITFGSFNNIAKLSDSTLSAWATLLQRVEGSTLLIKSRFFGEGSSRERFLRRLDAAGIPRERLTLLEGIPAMSDHLAAYGRVDVSLDSFPYNGTTTLCESLWMGVPVVTLRGADHRSRVGASLLTHIGLPELVADTVEAYVDIATSLVADPGRLAALRAGLRERVAASPIGDPKGFARKIEAAYQGMMATARRDRPLRVEVIDTFENYGGAALAANRLFKALRAEEVAASMLVLRRGTDDKAVRVPEPSAEREASEAARRHQIDADLVRFADQEFRPLGEFSLDRTVAGAALIDSLAADADVFNLHWVAEFLDWELFFAPGRVRVPVVWTLHDMRPFTGGCHYSGACRNYRTGCGECPFFFPLKSDDPSRAMARRQRLALEAWGGALHIVTPSQWLAEQARSSAVLTGVPVSVIPNSIDIDAFQPLDKAAARRAMGLPPNAFVLAFVASDLSHSRKGATCLIEALTLLSDLPGLHLVTAGVNPPDFPGHVSHHPAGELAGAAIAPIYAAADLVVLPTLEDNLPNVILESFACGRPVVGSRVGGVPDHVVEGETGFLVSPADPASLAASLRAAFTDRGRLEAMGRACRVYAEREFSPKIQAERYKTLFQQMVRAAKPPRAAPPPQESLAMTEKPVASGSFDEVLVQLSQIVGSHPRRRPGHVVIGGTRLDFVDLHSLYYQCLQIFKAGYYAFDSAAPDPLIIDCGANIGIASLYFAGHVPGATIEAYEADPAIAQTLRANLAAWGVGTVTAHPAAVWIDDKGVVFAESHDDSGHVAEAGDQTGIRVPSIRLRDRLAGRRVEMLKLDVEGAEYALLADCDGALDGVAKMIIEVHHMQDGPNRLGELLHIVERNGFRYTLIDLNFADWVPGTKPPFAAAPTDRFIVTVLAWKPA
jgi:FkbM family methyltransferase